MNQSINSEIDPIQVKINDMLISKLLTLGVLKEDIDSGNIRLQTLFYQIYWYNRLKNNPQEQELVFQNFKHYLFYNQLEKHSVDDLDIIFKDQVLINNTNFYIQNFIKPIKTIDLVITPKDTDHKSPQILTLERNFFPLGLALPGGFVLDTDQDNEFKLRMEMFSALRVISTKIFNNSQLNISKSVNNHGKDVFSVISEKTSAKITIKPLDEKGFVFRENIKLVLRPSDPRHVVDTIAFKCILEGELELTQTMKWASKSDLMDTTTNQFKLAFNHHRELINQITAQSDLDKELTYEETSFIRDIIHNPVQSYKLIQQRFIANDNNVNTPMPELFPVVSKLLNKMFSDEINNACTTNTTLAGIRDKATISLRHVSLKNRVFCAYLPTIRAIFEAIAFFDVYSREKRNFYAGIKKDSIHEHNPATLPASSYHMYRYKYRMDDLLSLIPKEIIIPTFESFTATDLMLVRCVPIRFVGLATDFLYVDEFEQSPEEFLMHDINHNWRMINEDKATIKKLGITQEELMLETYEFSKLALANLKFKATDTTEQIELKKIKLIILFEIVHEDARPFLKSIINEYIQLKEGGQVPFEVPRIDPVTNYMDMVDTLDTGISTLSYVRNKLQYGFYDQVDNQSSELVEPSYRTAENIALAAYQLLIEYDATANPVANLDEDGNVSYEWLLKRVCAVGPDNIHNTEFIDPAVLIHGDGADKLNPKRYQSGVE